MKATVRILATVLVLLLAAVPMTASAETVEGANQSRIVDVQAKYADGVTTPDVYSLDVSWGAMQFTYSQSGSRVWDPANHAYTENTTTGWAASGNTVTVTNHSNRDVTVTFSYEKGTGYDGVSGTFDIPTDTLTAGEVGNVEGADSVTAKLTLSGTLASNVTEFTKVGTVKISLR